MRYDRRAEGPGFRKGKTRRKDTDAARDGAGYELVDPDFDVVDVGDLLRVVTGSVRSDDAGTGAW